MATFTNLIGQRINGIFIANENKTLIFRTNEYKFICYETENDCCNEVWINHFSGAHVTGDPENCFDALRGALVISTEDKGWTESRTNPKNEWEVVQDGFWTIQTDRGYIDIEVRNEHNGYYGGHLNEQDDFLLSLDELVEITEDF